MSTKLVEENAVGGPQDADEQQTSSESAGLSQQEVLEWDKGHNLREDGGS